MWRGARAVQIGASFIEQAVIGQLQGHVGGRLLWTRLGVGGERADQIRTRITDVYALAPEICVIDAGGNDLLQGRAVDDVKADLTAMYEGCRTNGIEPYGCGIQPLGRSAGWTVADEEARAEMDAWIPEQVSRTFFYCDALGDGNVPNGIALAYDNGDAIHPNALGRRVAAIVAHEQLFASARR